MYGVDVCDFDLLDDLKILGFKYKNFWGNFKF